MNHLQTNRLAAEICACHAAACKAVYTSLDHARHCGELLTQAKDGLPHGEWLPWLAKHCPAISIRSAQGYMRLADRWPEIEAARAKCASDFVFGIGDALHLLAEPKAEPNVPTDEWRENFEALGVLSKALPHDLWGTLNGELDRRVAWMFGWIDSPMEPTPENLARLQTVAGWKDLEIAAAERRVHAERELGTLLREADEPLSQEGAPQ